MYEEVIDNRGGPVEVPKHKTFSRRSAVGTGTTSLLMIFTVLCFATLAMLSLSTAVTSRNMQQRSLQSSAGLARAKGDTAQEVALLDAELAALQGAPYANDEAYYTAARQAAESLGWAVNAETGTLSLRVATDQSHVLVTVLALEAPGAEWRYTVQRQVSTLSEGWQPEDPPGLWQG